MACTPTARTQCRLSTARLASGTTTFWCRRCSFSVTCVPRARTPSSPATALATSTAPSAFHATAVPWAACARMAGLLQAPVRGSGMCLLITPCLCWQLASGWAVCRMFWLVTGCRNTAASDGSSMMDGQTVIDGWRVSCTCRCIGEWQGTGVAAPRRLSLCCARTATAARAVLAAPFCSQAARRSLRRHPSTTAVPTVRDSCVATAPTATWRPLARLSACR